MANAMYPKGLEAFLSGGINLPSDTIKVALLKSGYSYSQAHQYYSDLGANVVATQTLSGKSVTGGTFDADDPVFTALSGLTVVAYALYKDTGSGATSPLAAFYDTATDLPFTPDGTDKTLSLDNGINKLFRIQIN